MSEIKKLILDVLKPHKPSIIELAKKLGNLPGVLGVNCSLEEVDQDTESLTISIEGTAIAYDKILEMIKECGAVVHSIDSVSTGKKLIERTKGYNE